MVIKKSKKILYSVWTFLLSGVVRNRRLLKSFRNPPPSLRLSFSVSPPPFLLRHSFPLPYFPSIPSMHLPLVPLLLHHPLYPSPSLYPLLFSSPSDNSPPLRYSLFSITIFVLIFVYFGTPKVLTPSSPPLNPNRR